MTPAFTVVVPTVGRTTLSTLLRSIDACPPPYPAEIVVVDDRPGSPPPLDLPTTDLPTTVVRSGGRGPAAARNAGWRHTGTEWVAFLDDDVVVGSDWTLRLAEDLDVAEDVGATQGRIVVPLPGHRRPTDAERGTAGLAGARWITADMAYRRATLAEVGGFDERFPRAYREDADLALRVCRVGYRVVGGHRRTVHPVRVDPWFASLRAQAGNADDALMRRRHGRRWRELIGEGRGRIGSHAVTTAAGVLGLAVFAPAGSRLRSFGVGAAAVWVAATAEFAVGRLLRGPATSAEIVRMAVTSVLIPPLACAHRVRGARRARRTVREPAAVLFDRDDTVIVDVPYLSDASLVRPVAGAASALRRLRGAGVPVGIVSNQSGVAIGLITPEQLGEVNARVVQLLGPFDTVQVCPHADRDGCGCRKPAPGLIRRAAAELGVDVRRCVVIGDTGADVGAAVAAGALAVLVPTSRTRAAEVESARRTAMVAPDIESAVDLAMGAMR